MLLLCDTHFHKLLTEKKICLTEECIENSPVLKEIEQRFVTFI